MMLICAWPSAGPTGGAGVALPASICNLTDVCTFFGAICSLFYENLYRLLWHRHSCLCSLNFLWTAGALACESLSSSVLWHRLLLENLYAATSISTLGPLPNCPKLPNIAEIVLFTPNCLLNSSSIWILWQFSILAIAYAATFSTCPNYSYTGVARPKIVTITFNVSRSSFTSSTVPLKFANGPSVMRTVSFFSNFTRILGLSLPTFTR